MIARTAPGPARRSKRVLPGFGLTMGMVLTYLGVIVLLPVVALVLKGPTSAPPASGPSSPRRERSPRCG